MVASGLGAVRRRRFASGEHLQMGTRWLLWIDGHGQTAQHSIIDGLCMREGPVGLVFRQRVNLARIAESPRVLRQRHCVVDDDLQTRIELQALLANLFEMCVFRNAV